MDSLFNAYKRQLNVMVIVMYSSLPNFLVKALWLLKSDQLKIIK